jgi:hypothetical protein
LVAVAVALISKVLHQAVVLAAVVEPTEAKQVQVELLDKVITAVLVMVVMAAVAAVLVVLVEVVFLTVALVPHLLLQELL